MIIIGIAGGTGSGKTTVVKSIIDSLPADEVALLPLIRMLSTGTCFRNKWRCLNKGRLSNSRFIRI